MEIEKNRRIHLIRDVDQASVNAVIKSILEIEEKDLLFSNEAEDNGMVYNPRPIRLFIDSYGGSCYQGRGLADVIQLCSTPVHTICSGVAMSMGLYIFLAGHRRFSYPRARFMFHQVSSGTEGKVQDMLEDLGESEFVQADMIDWVSRRTRISKSTLRKNQELKRDWYIGADEALKLGICHEILTSNPVN